MLLVHSSLLPTRMNRRDFTKIGLLASSHLMLGVRLTDPLTNTADTDSLKPNAWLEVTPDNEVRIFVAKLEMGQGVRTALPMIIADELDADWNQVRVVQATVEEVYKPYVTGGSWSIAGTWKRLRQAGATGRMMLLIAAANRWQVDPSTCLTQESKVVHQPTGRFFTYGALSTQAAKVPIPQQVGLKQHHQFTIIGRSQNGVDGQAIVRGKSIYGIDVRIPNMLYASIERCPVIGGKIESVDSQDCLNVKGVRYVVPIAGTSAPHHLRSGVAVVADTTWAAMKGRKALTIRWDEGPNQLWNTSRIDKTLLDGLHQPGYISRQDGHSQQALVQSVKHLGVTYKTQFLAHAPMEPMTAVANVQQGKVDMWVACQEGTRLRQEVSLLTGIPIENVLIHVPLAGGSFGRRGKLDYALEAVIISNQLKKPVQVLWTREDDIKHGAFRAGSVHQVRAGFDEANNPVALQYKVVTASVGFFENPLSIKDGYDENIVIGANNFPYTIPAIQVESRIAHMPIPVRWWRGQYHSHSIFALEVFMDEMATAVNEDPLTFRLKRLEGASIRSFKHSSDSTIKVDIQRLRNVLTLAAEKANWGSTLPPQHGRGLACHFYDSECYIAQVIEVKVEAQDKIKVIRVVSAVDCGVVVNPTIAQAQIEGGVIFGLSAAFNQAITYENGRVVQSNFSDFPVLRFHQSPQIEVHFVASEEPPGGLGEAGVPGVLAALSNAIYSATGVRIRELPILTN